MIRCPICFNKPMNCDCSEEARQLYYLRQEMGESPDEQLTDIQTERRELFKRVALAIISNNYHHSDWLKGADWINPVVENILSAAAEFSKKDSHE